MLSKDIYESSEAYRDRPLNNKTVRYSVRYHNNERMESDRNFSAPRNTGSIIHQ